MSTTIYFAANVTRMFDRADAALVSPGVRLPLSQLAFAAVAMIRRST